MKIRSLKNAMTIKFILVALFPIILITGTALYSLSKHIAEDVDNNNTTLAKILAGEIERYINEPLTTLNHVKHMIEDKNLDRIDVTSILTSEVHELKHVESLAILDKDNRIRNMIFSANTKAGKNDYLGMDLSGMKFYQEAKLSKSHKWSNTFISTTSGEPTFMISLPFKQGLIVGNFNLKSLQTIIERVSSRTDCYAYVVNAEGTLIAHPNRTYPLQQLNIRNLEIIRQGLAGNYGNYRYLFMGRERIGSIVPVTGTGWMVGVAQDAENAFASLIPIKIIFATGILGALLLALLAAFWSSWRLLIPLTSLAGNAQKMMNSDYTVSIVPVGYRELDELGAEFSLMADAVKAREKTLLERNEELKATEEELRRQLEENHQNQLILHDNFRIKGMLAGSLDNTPLGMILWELAGNNITISDWNPAAERIFGWTREEMLGKDPFELLPANELIHSGPEIAELLVTSRYPTNYQHTCKTKSGAIVEIKWFNTPIPDSGPGVYRVMSLADDVTCLKRAEDEIKTLNEELEQRVVQRTAQLAAVNQELESEIQQREEAQEEINWLNRDLQRRAFELEAANEELELFSCSVSHDLRAPLRHIEGFSQMLMDECGDRLDQHGKQYLNRVIAASKRMGLLISALLNLARLSRSKLKQQKVNLSEIACEITEDLKQAGPERQIDVQISEGLAVVGDPQLLRVVLENLLGNAWKYSGKRECPTIEFGVSQINGDTAFFVRDNGAGFDMIYAEKLFGPFQRLHRADEFEGTGIGLATVQRIIHRHGGRVWAEGEVEKGATFYFTLAE